MKPWYLSCPHACSDPKHCPYGEHLKKIRALLQELRDKNKEIEDLHEHIANWQEWV